MCGSSGAWTRRDSPRHPLPSASPRHPLPPYQPPAPAAAETAEEPEPGVRAPRSEAYDVLAGLGRREPRLQLSEGDCVELEHLVGEWLARGVGREQITQALTSGLAGVRALRRTPPP